MTDASGTTCECGCGGVPKVIKTTDPSRDRVRGQHYRFLRGHNNPNRKAVSVAEHVLLVQGATGCVDWRGHLSHRGYGIFRIKGNSHQAHRLVYEAVVGPIPDGLALDHLCRNRACVNPAHLEPVTTAENTRRALAAQATLGGSAT